MEKKIAEMVEAGFVTKSYKGTEEEVDKKYKCFLSKKCNDEKFERIKKMFEYVKSDPAFKDYMGLDFAKLDESYGKKDKRGQIVTVDYTGMSPDEAFKAYRVGVKEVLKKGYTLNDKDLYEKK